MAKYRTTRKAIKESYDVYSIGNGNLQTMLKLVSPFAYSTRVEGWACDYYDVGNGVVLCDGYATIGKKVDYATMELFENKAREIWERYRSGNTNYDKMESTLNHLVKDFVGTIAKGE